MLNGGEVRVFAINHRLLLFQILEVVVLALVSPPGQQRSLTRKGKTTTIIYPFHLAIAY